MQRLYKFFLGLFVIFVGVNLYAFEWDKGLLHEDNTKFLVSLVAGIVGLLLVYVLSTWSKISVRKES